MFDDMRHEDRVVVLQAIRNAWRSGYSAALHDLIYGEIGGPDTSEAWDRADGCDTPEDFLAEAGGE